MLFNVPLYISLAIFTLGLIYKVSTWFSRKIGRPAQDFTTSERASAAVKGIAGVVFSAKLLTLIKVFILDVVLQIRILQEDFLRWLMHMLIYGGFMLLLLMHALETHISEAIFSNYYSTLNPFFFLRDFFGLMVFAGIVIAIFRRFILKVPRMKTNVRDYYAIIILIVIMVSGVFLEGAKITSISAYQAMVADYAELAEDEDIQALESYWVENFGVVSPNVKAPFDADVLARGEELHEESCMSCHSSPKWAFSGYATAKIIKPIALALDRAGTSTFLWYIHFLAGFIGLAYLPFSKMFHIFSTPISLLANAVMDRETSAPANVATRQAMELDACMHCSTCSLRCSASMAFHALGNDYILPAEKMAFLRKMAAGKDLNRKELHAILEGVYLCTNCDRCTVVCPAGINLRELWFNVREDLVQRECPEPLVLSPFSFVRALNQEKLPANDYVKPIENIRQAVAADFEQAAQQTEPLILKGTKTDQWSRLASAGTFAYCFGCQTCTTVCPVAACYENPRENLDLLPHQIMNCLGLGLVEMASGARMIWDCATCYQCQEHCPQNVRVTDLLYQLKNHAVENFEKTQKAKLSDSKAA
ncbi:MAG: 4Fe-4S dicluster domain-containing protein [Pseudomonadota bacterium]